MKYICTLLLGMLLSPLTQAESLLLTGVISSGKKQIITAPRGSRWNIQIQWMAEEGKVVQQGEQIVVFDGSTEQAKLEQNQERLETLKLELSQTRMRLEQAVTQAEGAFKLAKMRVAKAQVEASVPASEVSDYDKGQYDLALQRALLEQVRAEEKLKLAQQELQTGLQKKRIDILGVQEEIKYLHKLLAKMAISAQFSGPVNYANHPWSNTKLAAGMNVQPSWNILDVQAIGSFHVQSWVHEIDADKLQPGQPVTLVLDAFPDQKLAGRLQSMGSQAEKKPQWSNSVYYPLVVEFSQQPALKLLPGMSVRVLVDESGELADAR